MIKKIVTEWEIFLAFPHHMRTLTITNFIYGMVMPIIEIFVAAYIMRNSNDASKVVAYQLSIYTGFPIIMLLNGYLLRTISIKKLYTFGMLLSSISLLLMTFLPTMDILTIATSGLIMGFALGFYWANRNFLALSTTNDSNRNYFFGIESFLFTIAALMVPALAGLFIAKSKVWLGSTNNAYRILIVIVFFITVMASIIFYRATYVNPPASKFLYFKFHTLWNKMFWLGSLKGLGQGYIVTAPAILIMRLVGGEETLGYVQSIGNLIAAILMYLLGRKTSAQHRVAILTAGLLFFVFGGFGNAMLFNAVGVLFFVFCLAIGRPMMDMGFYPIQMWAVNEVSAIEKRNDYAYMTSMEFALYIGRMIGCCLFLFFTYAYNANVVLRFSLLGIGLVQLISIPLAKNILSTKIKNLIL